MTDLRVPETVEDPFREHYRALIVGSLLRSAEVEGERHRARGHRLRARRAERVVGRLRPTTVDASPLPPAPAPVPVPVPRSVEYDTWFGPGIRRTALIVWLMTLAALVADVVVLGVGSYATMGADLGLVAMTFILFFACMDDLTGPRR